MASKSKPGWRLLDGTFSGPGGTLLVIQSYRNVTEWRVHWRGMFYAGRAKTLAAAERAAWAAIQREEKK